MNSFPKDAVLAACKEYGLMLKLPVTLDSINVMIAIAAVESGGGDVDYIGNNCGPRYEPAYDVGGSIYSRSPDQQSLIARWGKDAACSYGPWQCMFDNCLGHTPQEMETSIDICAQVFVIQFNNYVEKVRHASTLDEIGEVWNLGHIAPDPAYTDKLEKAYGSIA